MDSIDFVIPWVDGSDPVWQEQFYTYRKLYTPAIATEAQSGDDISKYTTEHATPNCRDDSSEERYRDWDIIRYWFRSVEKFAPWVNRIHFVTYGHLPSWLDVSHPKLNIVNHGDFIPPQYLPTFSSCPIETNIHRIEGLANQFVYFNDDMLFCRQVEPERFFKGGLPRDMARLNVIRDERIDHNILECVRIINRRHRPKGAILRNAGKWFNYRYSIGDMVKTFTLLPWSFYPGFRDSHAPQPFLKDTFDTLWAEEQEALDASCRNRFRTLTDLPQWLMRYEQLATGQFAPVAMRDMGLSKLTDDNSSEIAEMILSGIYSVLCINDNNEIKNTEQVRKSLLEACHALLPNKSAYEL